MSENTYKWENSKKKTPEQNKNLVAWTKDKGLSQARRSKEGKWTLSNHDGQTWYTDDEGSGGAKLPPPFTK
jgi:hypothetical protein